MQSESNQKCRNTMYFWLAVGLISLGRIAHVDAEHFARSNISDQNVDFHARHGDSRLISNNWYNSGDENIGSRNSYINKKRNHEDQGTPTLVSPEKIERRDPRSTRGRGTRVRSFEGNRGRSVGVTQGTGKGTGTGTSITGHGNVHGDSSFTKRPTTNPKPKVVNPTVVQDHTTSTPSRDFDAEIGTNKPKTFTEKAKGYGQDTTDVLDTFDQISNHPVTQGIKDSIWGNPEEVIDPTNNDSAYEPISDVNPETPVADTEESELETESK